MFACCLALISCVDSDYDLRDEIDMSVGIGGDYLALPLGNTELISLKKIIKTENSDLLQTDASGNYRLLQQDDISVESAPLEPVTLHVNPHRFDPMRLDFDRETGPLPELPSGTVPAVWIEEESLEQIDASLPTQVKALEWMQFQNEVHAVLQIRADGSSSAVRKLKFDGLKLIFPDYVALTETGTSEISLYDEFALVDGYVRQFGIERLAFEHNPVTESHLRLEVPVRLEGQIAASEMAPGATEPGQVVLNAVLTLSDMPVGLIQGQVDPQLEETYHQVDLTDIPQFLQDEDVVFDIQPSLAVQGKNTLGMALNIDWLAVPFRNGEPISEGTNEVVFSMDASPVPGEVAVSRLWLSATEEAMPEGYRYVEALRLPHLLRKVPDRIDFAFRVSPDMSRPQLLDLSLERYPLEMSYELNIPLSFGPSLQLLYRDTIRDLQSDIGELLDKLTSLEISSEATSTIPLELQCRLIPVNVDLSPLEGVEVSTPASIQPGGRQGEAVQSPFEVTIRETVAGSLAALDGLILEVTGKGNESIAHVPLNDAQYLQFTMQCRIPGGLHLDMDDL